MSDDEFQDSASSPSKLRKLWHLGLRHVGNPEITQRQLEKLLIAIGGLESRILRTASISGLGEAEFQVFSQWGEDGILQYLMQRVPITDTSFVELGVGDYTESNTRFLLVHDNWRGLVVDSGSAHIGFLNRSGLRFFHEIEARQVFLTRDNINDVLSSAGFVGDIGLLSIDVDGNDYWLLEALKVVRPRIVVVEYNSVFGYREPISIPYDPQFDYTIAHFSNLYFGASIAALCHWAESHGYAFVGSNTSGCNAFFVREDVRGNLRALTPSEGYVASRFRTSRGPKGALTYVSSHEERLRLIGTMVVCNVVTGEPSTISDLFAL